MNRKKTQNHGRRLFLFCVFSFGMSAQNTQQQQQQQNRAFLDNLNNFDFCRCVHNGLCVVSNLYIIKINVIISS